MVMHLLNQFKECNTPTHAFSLWILLQFVDFKLLQDRKVLFYFTIYTFIFINLLPMYKIMIILYVLNCNLDNT